MTWNSRELALVAVLAVALGWTARAQGDDAPPVKCATWRVENVRDEMARDGVTAYDLGAVNQWSANRVATYTGPVVAEGYTKVVFSTAGVPAIGSHLEWYGAICMAK